MEASIASKLSTGSLGGAVASTEGDQTLLSVRALRARLAREGARTSPDVFLDVLGLRLAPFAAPAPLSSPRRAASFSASRTNRQQVRAHRLRRCARITTRNRLDDLEMLCG